MRVLDNNLISFDIGQGKIEVFDHNDNLLGSQELSVEIDEGMEADAIYQTIQDAGYSIDEIINVIIDEAVFEKQQYDLWYTEEGVIYYSPSQGEWVQDPIEGVFKEIRDNFTPQD